MSLKRFHVTLTTLVLWTCLGPSVGWPFLERTTVLTPRKFLKSSVVQSMAVVPKQHDAKNGIRSTGINSSPASIGVNFYRLPPSPANLLKPDGFQFYTYNERGEMITKQMTMQEIQALIAAGGPDHSNIGIQEPQKAEDILTGGKKVMDVVEKVQSVLKSAMDKPSTLTGSIPNSVPDKVNVEWSNILPAILAGDKYGDKIDEPHRVEEVATTVRNPPSDLSKLNTTVVSSLEPPGDSISVEQKEEPISQRNQTQEPLLTTTSESPAASYTEKLMIPVPVITAEQKPQTMYHTTQSSLVFQKITEMVPLENAFVESQDRDKIPMSMTTYESTTPNAPPSSFSSTSNNYDSTQVASTTSDSKVSVTEEIVHPSTTESKIKPTSTWTNEELETDLTTKPVSVTESEKIETSVNESFTTFVSSTDKPSTRLQTESSIAYDAVTKSSELEFTQPLKPLSAELENSLSSMINQISEGPASSVLTMSGDLESPHQIVEEKSKNSSEASTTTVAAMVDTTTRLSTIVEERPPLNVENTTFKEPLQESTLGTTMKLEVEDEILPTVSPVFSVASTSSTPLEETTSYVDVSTNVQDTVNATETIDSSPSTSFSETTDKITMSSPPESPETNLAIASSNSSMMMSDAGQQSGADSVAIVEDILRTVSIEANVPVTEAIVLPNISMENLPTKTLASALIAGFGTTVSNATENTTPLPEKVGSIDVTPCSKSTTSLVLETQTATSVLPTVDAVEKNATNETLLGASEPNVQSETVTLGTTDRTVSVTSVEYSQTKADEPSTVSKSTISMPTTDSYVMDATSRIVTDQDDAPSSSVYETTTIKILSIENSTNAAQVSGVTVENQQSASSTEMAEVVSRPDRIPLEALKKDDTTSVTQSEGNANETIVRDTTVGHEKPSTNVRNSTDIEKQTVEKPLDLVHVGTSNPMGVGTTEVPAKEKSELDATTVGIVEEESATSAKESIATTTNLPTVDTKESNGNGSFDVLKDEAKRPAESHESTVKLSGSTSKPELPPPHQTLGNSKPSSSSKLNATDVDADDKWQRIPLHQTASWSTTTKKPTEASESTTGTRLQTTSTTPSSEADATVSLNASKSTNGLDTSTRNASMDIVNFSRLCNELAFKFWISANKGLSTGRSLALSPFGMISMLAMIFLGARGSTSEQMNEVLGLDNVATFNPHLIFQNVTDAVSLARHQGIANAAFVRELFADKVKVRKLLPFYKEQAQQFYEGLVAEMNFATISDLARRRTNLLIRKQTGGRIKDFVKSNAVPLRSPLAAISANVFQTDCNTSVASTTGRDGELYFAVSSAHRLRKLIPVPATVWRSNVLAGYEPSLDATAVALGGADKLVSTIFLLPGQQGHVAPGDTLDRLEQRLVKDAFRDGTWNKLLKVLIPRPGLELQIPKFSHRSVVNATAALKRMGLDRLFSSDADFKGINGGIGNRLFLSDVLQMNLFSTCGDENVGNGRHHVEIYPASPSLRNSRNEEKDGDSMLDVPSKNYRTVPTRGAIRNTERSEDKPRLKLDQPFLYFVRHNPTGLILHMGRFNPRLL
ncbi:uncharacterized protein LOC143346738 [Colletes latitarsis]|uniref:uncharacterized protein LOC143346738 n=1 Tax=Colletes latitarsis TaxID=2605962 RepID=UPI0040354309